jgi:hypothetical protein
VVFEPRSTAAYRPARTGVEAILTAAIRSVGGSRETSANLRQVISIDAHGGAVRVIEHLFE